MIPAIGERLQNGKYLVNDVLTHDQLSVSFRATHQGFNQPVILKTLNRLVQDGEYRIEIVERFLAETERLAKFCHPHLVRIIDCFLEQDWPFMVMDVVPGQSLAHYLSQGPLPAHLALRYISQVGQAVSFIHQLGLHHGNIGPHSVVIHTDTQTAILVDLEAACQTPCNTSVETAIATDIRDLAATLYGLLTGSMASAPGTTAPSKLNPDIPPSLSEAIMQGLMVGPRPFPSSVQDWLSLLPAPATVDGLITEQLAGYSESHPTDSTSTMAHSSARPSHSRAISSLSTSARTKARFPKELLFWSAAIAGSIGAGFGLFFKSQLTLSSPVLQAQPGVIPSIQTIEESFPPRFSEHQLDTQTDLETSEPNSPPTETYANESEPNFDEQDFSPANEFAATAVEDSANLELEGGEFEGPDSATSIEEPDFSEAAEFSDSDDIGDWEAPNIQDDSSAYSLDDSPNWIDPAEESFTESTVYTE